jgi:O-antigen/teichoic acid export membrane protein
LSRVVIPRISSLGSRAALTEREFVVSKSVKHAVVVSFVAAIGMAAALPAVPYVIGHDFEPTVLLGWILVPGTAAIGVSNVFAATIVGSGRPGYLWRVTAVVTPLTLALYFILIPTFRATGAAVASTISYSATLVLCWFFFRRVSGISDVRTILPGRAEVADYVALIGRARVRVRPE